MDIVEQLLNVAVDRSGDWPSGPAYAEGGVMAIPSGNTREVVRRQVLRLALDGGVSTFVLEGNRKLACAVTDMLATGEIVRTQSQYPWVGLALRGEKTDAQG